MDLSQTINEVRSMNDVAASLCAAGKADEAKAQLEKIGKMLAEELHPDETGVTETIPLSPG